MKYETTRKISTVESKVLNALLKANQQQVENLCRIIGRRCKRDTVLATISGEFVNGYKYDVKVCNGEPGPWIDTVLFDPNGIEVAVDQPSDGPIEGEYCLQPNAEDEYILTIQS
jgi:hypothetical protein